MAGITDTVRGDGPVGAHGALEPLMEDASQLERTSSKLSCTPIPQPYSSETWHSTTPPLSLAPLSSEQQLQLECERLASLPSQQFSAQRREEENRIYDADLDGTCRLAVGALPYQIAYDTIKKRWLEQGIWNNKWNAMAHGLWKHEEPLELEPESETDSEAESSPGPLLFGVPLRPRQPKSNDKKQRILARRVILEREREASRPCHQFFYQISKERERIQEARNVEDTFTPDVNTMAYINVKNTWIRRGIWNERWGILPGMSWKHEHPPEQLSADDRGLAPARMRSNAPLLISRTAGGLFSEYDTRSPSASELHHHQGSSIANASRKGEHSNHELPLAPDSTPLIVEGQDLTRTIRPLKRYQEPSRNESLATNAVLDGFHSAKVPKATQGEDVQSQQQRKPTREPSSGHLQSSSCENGAESHSLPAHMTLRRSERIRGQKRP